VWSVVRRLFLDWTIYRLGATRRFNVAVGASARIKDIVTEKLPAAPVIPPSRMTRVLQAVERSLLTLDRCQFPHLVPGGIELSVNGPPIPWVSFEALPQSISIMRAVNFMTFLLS
jgi:hypothetical protein